MRRIRSPRSLAGVVLALHGAMVAGGEDDTEDGLLREVRATAGQDVPIASAIVDVEAGGLSSSDLASFPYRTLRRPVAPLDDGVWSLD